MSLLFKVPFRIDDQTRGTSSLKTRIFLVSLSLIIASGTLADELGDRVEKASLLATKANFELEQFGNGKRKPVKIPEYLNSIVDDAFAKEGLLARNQFADSPTFWGRYNSMTSFVATLFPEFKSGEISLLTQFNSELERMKHQKITLTDREKIYVNDFFFKLPLSAEAKKAQKLRAIVGYGCGPSGGTECYKAMRRVLTLMAPRSVAGKMYAVLPLWKSLMTQQEFLQGLARGTQTVLKKVELAKTGERISGNIFEDLKDGFTASGLSDTKAHQYAMGALGLYGSRGAEANKIGEALAIETAEVFPAKLNGMVDVPKLISIIGSAISVLDMNTAAGGHPYSLPKEIISHIHYGRPYHFWMSAYLTTQLESEGYGKYSSFKAPYRMATAYEAFAEVTTTRYSHPGPEMERATLIESRKDVIHAGAGSAWAAYPENLLNIDLIYFPSNTKATHFADKAMSISWTKKYFQKIAASTRFERNLGADPEGLRIWLSEVQPFTIESFLKRKMPFSRLSLTPVKKPLSSDKKSAKSCLVDTLKKILR